MKLSTRARYALRAMVAMYRLSEGGQPVSLERVSHRTHVSRRYLEQIAIQLRHASLIHGVSGRGGGYVIARDPQDINLAEIVEATIGPINVVDCVMEPDICMLSETCECRAVYCLLNDRIKGVLSQFTLADLALGKHRNALTEGGLLSDATRPHSGRIDTSGPVPVSSRGRRDDGQCKKEPGIDRGGPAG